MLAVRIKNVVPKLNALTIRINLCHHTGVCNVQIIVFVVGCIRFELDWIGIRQWISDGRFVQVKPTHRLIKWIPVNMKAIWFCLPEFGEICIEFA